MFSGVFSGVFQTVCSTEGFRELYLIELSDPFWQVTMDDLCSHRDTIHIVIRCDSALHTNSGEHAAMVVMEAGLYVASSLFLCLNGVGQMSSDVQIRQRLSRAAALASAASTSSGHSLELCCTPLAGWTVSSSDRICQLLNWWRSRTAGLD